MKKPGGIIRLLETGSCPYSMINSKIISELKSIRLIQIETSGSRRRISVFDKVQFKKWVDARYPEPGIAGTRALPRAKNIVDHKNSKAGKTTHQNQPILFKWIDTDKKNVTRWGNTTKQFGFCGVLSSKLNLVNFPQKWSLLFIENWESFVSYTAKSPVHPIIIIYLGGNISDVSLKAISKISHEPTDITHFGDYDWSGLAIFQRIKAFLPKTFLYRPDNLEYYFKNFGKRELAFNQKPPEDFNSTCPQSFSVIHLIEQFNAGLEQEVIPPPSAVELIKQPPLPVSSQPSPSSDSTSIDVNKKA